ncbi:MAG: DUF1460 domain-containing protein [Ignavibacteriales bacterium]|nr:DUF1460 domain-containing protein [Ignavibacteriales bacterium]
MDRRSFLISLPLAVGAPLFFRNTSWGDIISQDDDTLICTKKFELAVSLGLRNKSIGDVVVEIGKSFLGVDYIANLLEQPGAEQLVVNLRGLDCVLFCENALVFARCVKKNKTTFDDYKAELQHVRYRGGIINQYPSRLHYFSDHIYDNEKKGVVKNVTKEIGGAPFRKTINFMSTHPDSYIKLKENPEFVNVIRKQEEAINKRTMYHIPKGQVQKIASKIHNGDIIAITTDIEGMDVSHTGIAVWENDSLRLMHAPLSGHRVQITEKTLADYLAANKKQLGIMVARPLEPA